MCNDRALFNNSDFSSHINSSPVLGADLANPLPVEGIGNISLAVSNGVIVLKDVLFVPAIGKNLICVSRLLSDGYSLTFNSAQSGLPGCIVRLKDRVVCFPFQKQNLWIVNPPHSPTAHVATTMADWHLRLGHIPPTVISKMAKNSSISGLEVSPGGRDVEECCIACPMGKQHRAPLTTTKNKERNRAPRTNSYRSIRAMGSCHMWAAVSISAFIH